MIFRHISLLVFSLFVQTSAFAAPPGEALTLSSQIGLCSSLEGDCGELKERLQNEILTAAWEKCRPLTASRVSDFNVRYRFRMRYDINNYAVRVSAQFLCGVLQ